jgi:hypothetical protein
MYRSGDLLLSVSHEELQSLVQNPTATMSKPTSLPFDQTAMILHALNWLLMAPYHVECNPTVASTYVLRHTVRAGQVLQPAARYEERAWITKQ